MKIKKFENFKSDNLIEYPYLKIDIFVVDDITPKLSVVAINPKSSTVPSARVTIADTVI